MIHNMSTYDVTCKACYLTFWHIIQIPYKQLVDSRSIRSSHSIQPFDQFVPFDQCIRSAFYTSLSASKLANTYSVRWMKLVFNYYQVSQSRIYFKHEINFKHFSKPESCSHNMKEISCNFHSKFNHRWIMYHIYCSFIRYSVRLT